ncbi:MAG: BamA/TamA family outer membrane protein [Deltaproteobacteria bacterium]|nr:BamA/TamA family outer membrane protein [Deltaproteobacteria bacterium]
MNATLPCPRPVRAGVAACLAALALAVVARPCVATTGPPRPDRAAEPGPSSPAPGAPLPRSVTPTERPRPSSPGSEGGESERVVPGLAESEKSCAGAEIATAELLGCVGTRCQDRDTRAKLLSLTDLRRGSRLAPDGLQRAVARLEATGFFRIDKVRCTLRPSGARIALSVLGNNVIRAIRFDGNRDVLESELRNKLLFQPGDVLNPETEDGRAQLARQKSALETLYQRAGFEDVQVAVTAESTGVGLVAIDVVIREGAKQHIATIRTKILDPHRPNKREEEAGLRCERVSERMISRASDLGAIDVFTRRAGVKGRGKIRGLLRQLGYHSPKVTITHSPAEQVVTVEVRLGRCSMVRVRGRESSELSGREARFTTMDDADIREVMPFAESGVFDLSEAERGRRELAAMLENRGYLFAEVELDYRDVPRSWGSRVASVITYRVTTNYLAQIRGLRFCDAGVLADAEARNQRDACEGRAADALAFEPSELQGAIETRPYDMLDEGGFLATAQMFGDLDRLRQFYRDAGYFEFRYGLVAPAGSGGGIVRRRHRTDREEIVEYLLPDRGFRVRRPVGEHFIYVEVPFEEGRRSRFVDVRVVGAQPSRLARVQQLFAVRRGDVASFTRVVDGLRKIEDDYRDLGYFQARFELLCATRNRAISAAGSKGLQTCTASRILAEEVELELRVVEGPRVQIGEIFVSGNFKTDRELLVRDMPAEGSDFSSSRLFESLRSLRNLGLFRSVSFRYIGRDEQPVRDRIAIVVQVVEDQSRFFDAAVGFQTVNVQRQQTAASIGTTPTGVIDILEHQTATGGRLGAGFGQRLGVSLPSLLLTAEAGLVDRNLFGEGKEGRIIARGGITPAILETLQPALLLGALSYYDRRFFGTETALRVIAPYFSRDFATTTIDIDKAGAAAEVLRRFGRLGLSVGVDGGLVKYRDGSQTEFKPWQAQFKVIPRLSYDALDSPINPSRGTYLTTSVALINALNEPTATSSQTVAVRGNFVKLEAQGKGYVTFRDTLTFGAMVRAGWAIGLGALSEDGQLPENERFRLGGQLGLRGFADNGVLRYDSLGNPIGATDSDGQPVCAQTNADGSCKVYAAENDGDVVLNGSIEARFPMLRDKGLWGALFWDWGGIADRWNNLHPSSIRHGVGFGVRFLVSGQIPIRLDYGIALDRRCLSAPDPTARSGCPEREAFGQLHAGLLYSF